jgi:hypothetical protein
MREEDPFESRAIFDGCDLIEEVKLFGKIGCAIDHPTLGSCRVDDGETHDMPPEIIITPSLVILGSRLRDPAVLSDPEDDHVGRGSVVCICLLRVKLSRRREKRKR